MSRPTFDQDDGHAAPRWSPRSGRGWRQAAWLASAVLSALATGLDAQQSTGARSLVTGQVYDSIARQPMPGVTVQLVNADAPGTGRPALAVTDSTGRYSMSDVAPGRYLAGFFHQALDTLGLEIPPRLVEVGRGTMRIDLATPSPRTIVRTICPTVNADSTGLFMGSVRATDSEAAIEGARVVVEWSEFVLDGVQLYERPRQTSVTTTGPGWFAFCGLPTDAVLQARAINGRDTTGLVDIEVPTAGLRYQSFYVGGARSEVLPTVIDALAAPGTPTARPVVVLRGDARLSGTVLDPSGKPVANAHVLVWGTEVDVQTNERGAFAIDGLPGGTHTVEVRVIGYVPVTRVVHLAAARPISIEVKLDRAAVILATETVRGKLVYSRRLVEFERRRRSGFGKYVTTEEIDRRPTAKLGQLLQNVLGVYVQSRAGQTSVTMRGSFGGYCVPTLYVDGHRDLSGDFDYLYADEIAGIEVYSRENQRPTGYQDSNRCGAVLVWTRARSTSPRKER